MWKLKKSSWFLFFGAMAISCLDQPDCFRLNSDQIGVSFKVLGTNKADVIGVYGMEINGVDSTFYPYTYLSSLLIDLNYLANQTGVTISGDKVSGSMLLKYLSQAQFVSDECGPRYILSNLTIDQQAGFDSIRLVTNQVNNPPYINIEIYRCPTTNLVKLDFYQLYIATNGKKSSQLLSVNVDNIIATYSGEMFYQDSTTNTVTLPINLNTGSSDFNMSIGGKLNTLSLAYTLTDEERYNVCPLATYASGLSASSVEFDSVSIAIVDKKAVDAPQDPATTNVLIFQCPKTNLMKVYFKTEKVEGTFVSATVTFNKITNNFSSDKYYEGKAISTVELPINESALNAEYYFDFKVKDGDPALIDTLSVSYEPFGKTIFNACAVQNVYDNLKATSPNILPSNILVPKDSLQFPSITNIEIIK
ncbi:MAG: hypothetical protein ABI663_13325 [Chryseolinea sp.]